MQFIINAILYGRTLDKYALLLDIRKNTAYTHNAALLVVRLTRVLPYKSALNSLLETRAKNLEKTQMSAHVCENL